VVRLGHVVLDVVEESAVKQATAILEHRPTRISLGDAGRLAYEAKIERLSSTQVRVLRLLLTGMTEKEMASRLFVSPHTVHSHIQAVYRELEVTSRAELMSMFIDRAVIEPHG
jgi:DNA-binding NarL/FixJ family response regulator